jgi:hypothetical protein
MTREATMERDSRKLRLEVDSLSVDSFDTEDVGKARGTVEAHADCTWFATCLCPTRYYYCGDGYYTIYSCNYTHDARCQTNEYTCTCE